MEKTKRFHLVICNEGDAYEAVFKTFEQARAYIERRETSCNGRIKLTSEERSLDFDTLDHILEGEKTKEKWEEKPAI
jgi:hypothetical protein